MYRIILITIAAICLLASSVFSAAPKLISYQGLLTDSSGSPLDTTVSIVFTIFNALTAGNVKWTETHPSVIVTVGLFDVILGGVVPIQDSVFNQPDRYLAVKVGGYPEMSPRTQLVSVGYSHRVNTVDGASGGTISGDLEVTGRATIGPGHTNTGTNAFVAGEFGTASGNYSTVSGGSVNEAIGAYASIGGGQSNLAGGTNATIGGGFVNIVSGSSSTVGGGSQNTASANEATVGGGETNSANGAWATVSGGKTNTASGQSSTVGGGEFNVASGQAGTVGGGAANKASDDASTVAGGLSNTATNSYAVVGGGFGNVAGGLASTIGGGKYNKARGIYSVVAGGGAGTALDSNSASGDYSAIGGGSRNTASGISTTISGGRLNIASNLFATIPGGLSNQAAGRFSFAAGRRAKADHDGSFVWADTTNSDFASTGSNQFLIRASGGVGIGTTAPNNPLEMSSGAHVTAGGTWTNASDENLKEKFRKIDELEILERIADLPVREWNYRAEDDAVRHIGPTAQDFRKAFGLGSDDKSITTVDADGIALAAIKALNKQNQEFKERLRILEEQVERLTD